MVENQIIRLRMKHFKIFSLKTITLKILPMNNDNETNVDFVAELSQKAFYIEPSGDL